MGALDVTIVSAFGRGNWMAYELASLGFQVALIDVSSSLGRWAPEDAEGPFGLFYDQEKLLPSQMARLHEEDDQDAVTDGFCIWTEDGPLDMRGMFSSYWFGAAGPMEAVKNYVSNFDKKAPPEQRRLRKAIERSSFKQTWLIHFAHQFAANLHRPSFESAEASTPAPLFAPFYVRRVTRRGAQKSLDWVATKGVAVQTGSVVDVQSEGTRLTGLEIQGERSGAVRSQNYLWTLTSLETEKVAPKVAARLFSHRAVPEWGWLRYRFAVELKTYQRTLPLHFAVIRELGLPWTHGNFLILNRTVDDKVFDVWLKVPTHHRFQKAYLEEIRAEILNVLESKLPGGHVKCLEMPQDYLYGFSELGPPLFPVYNEESLIRLKTARFKNIQFDGPERWARLDWTGRFSFQQTLVQRLEYERNLAAQRLKKKTEGGAFDRTIHPS